MYETNYHRASSVEDAISKLGSADDGKFVSGGQTLIPTMKQRLAAPSDLIDLRHVDSMKGITIDGNQVTIGAATTHAEVNASKELRAVCPSICDLAGHIGDPHVRHMGTLGYLPSTSQSGLFQVPKPCITLCNGWCFCGKAEKRHGTCRCYRRRRRWRIPT